MNFSFLPKYGSFFITGLKYTLILSISAAFFGFILGTVISFMKMSKNKLVKFLATTYIEFMRGTPLLVQILIVYLALPFDLQKVNAGILALTLNSAAYVAEIVRSGIEGIDDGQMEASRSLGMSYWMSMRYIVVPQAFKHVLPVLGNQFIAIIKDSSLISVIGVSELMFSTSNVRAAIYTDAGPLAVVSLLYLAMTFPISRVVVLIERRLGISDKGK